MIAWLKGKRNLSGCVKLQSNKLFYVYVFTICAQIAGANYPSPSCYYFKQNDISASKQENRTELSNTISSSCQIRKYDDHCLEVISIDEKANQDLTYYSTFNNSYFMNVTLRFNYPTKKFLIREKPSNSCWTVTIENGENPSIINVTHLPVTNYLSQIIAVRVSSVWLDLDSCENGTCSILNNSGLDFIPIANKGAIKLKLTVIEEGEYRVQILSGKCNIICDGLPCNCKVDVQNETIKLSSKKAFEKDYKNLKASHYYCARILSNCCAIHTHTVRLEAPSPETRLVVKRDIISYYFILVAIITLIILTVTFLFVRKIKFYSIIRLLQPSIQPERSEECVETLVPDNIFANNLKELKESVHIYLVYTNESNEFISLMHSYRKLLLLYVQKVWDPFSLEDAEIICSDVNWIHKTINDPKIRIVLIETEKSVNCEKRWIQGIENEFINEHYLNKYFINTLSSLKNDIQMLNNYARVFIVRLNSLPLENKLSLNLFARYQILEDFESLIYAIGNMSVDIDYQLWSNIKLRSNEKEEFQRKLNEYNVSVKIQ